MTATKRHFATLAVPVQACIDSFEHVEDSVLAGFMLGLDIARKDSFLGERLSELAGDALNVERNPEVLVSIIETIQDMLTLADFEQRLKEKP